MLIIFYYEKDSFFNFEILSMKRGKKLGIKEQGMGITQAIEKWACSLKNLQGVDGFGQGSFESY